MSKENDGKYTRENIQQREAFELYYSLGDSRTLEQVAEKIGKSTRTLYEWSRRFNWKERVEQYNIEVTKGLKDKTINAVVDEKANYRKIIKLAIMDFVARLQSGEVKVKSIADLERLMKLDLTLMGEVSEITEATTKVQLTDADRKAIYSVADTIKADLDAVE